MDHITIYFTLKVPAMYLSGYHKVDLVGRYIKCFKVDSMCAAAFCKQHQVIKGVFMREIKILVFLQVDPKTADQQIVLLKIRKLADVIYGDCTLHITKVRVLYRFEW